MTQHLPDPTVEPLRILVVEDDKQLRESLLEVLEEEGYLVKAVASGSDAITLAAENRFDLIVTDIKTPGTDGLSALATVKEGNPEVAGIVITGYSTEEYATRAAKLKVENYLKKPFEIDDFLRTVDSLAGKKRSSQLRMVREVVTHKALRWLALRLVEHSSGRTEKEVEQYVRGAVSSAPTSLRDNTEQLALESLAALQALSQQGLLWPTDLYDVFPSRLSYAVFSQNEQSALRDHLMARSQDFLAGNALAPEEEPVEDDSESLRGSLLNMALLLESAGRLEEARTAFEDLLKGSSDPTDRYLAHFGLARLARRTHRLDEVEIQTERAAAEGEKLGPLTHSQALSEGALLLCLASSPKAEAALSQAFDFAKTIKDADSFALMSLAREHFVGRAANHRDRLLGFLIQPEHFGLAMEQSDWLLDLLLGTENPEPVERRLLAKLTRACPGAFERVLQATQDTAKLTNGLAYLESLNEKQLQNTLAHLSSHPNPELVRLVAQREKKLQQQERARTPLRIFSFSGLRLYRSDEALEIKRKKPLLLLLYLLCRTGPVSEDVVLEAFWPGDESKARASLRTTLSIVRKLLCPDGELDPLSRQAGGLSIVSEVPIWFDYREFCQQIEQGKNVEPTQPERAMECYRAAVRLYRGPFLEGIYQDWALLIREETERALAHALRRLALASLSGRQWAQAHEYAYRGLKSDPLNRKFCEMTLQALIGLKRHHDALVIFENCRQALEMELSIEPTTEMLRLRELAKIGL